MTTQDIDTAFQNALDDDIDKLELTKFDRYNLRNPKRNVSLGKKLEILFLLGKLKLK